jgi:hypothetical protein
MPTNSGKVLDQEQMKKVEVLVTQPKKKMVEKMVAEVVIGCGSGAARRG